MPYVTAYSISYLNYDPSDKTEQLIVVGLYDASSFTTDPIDQSFIELIPSANPVQLSFLDTDENIFTPIRGRRAALSFLSAISLDINTFAKGADNNWIAVITVGSTFIFRGFLVLDDLRMRFITGKNPVLLDMTDGLATLSDIPLTDDSGDNIQGYYSLIELVALCLKKTGQELSIHVINSINPGSGAIVSPTGGVNFHSTGTVYTIRISDTYQWFPYVGQRITVTGSASNNTTFTVIGITVSAGTVFIQVLESITGEFPLTGVTLTDASGGRAFEKNFLEAKTFEKKIGETEDCRTVLDKILSAFGAFICQHDSEYWIYAVDDFRHTQYIRDNYTGDGVYVDSTTESSDKVISESAMFMADAASEVSLRRPAKEVVIEYRYEFPQEIPCNVDFSRGDEIAVISPTEKHYEVECWDFAVHRRNGFASSAATGDAYITKIFNTLNFEIERFIEVEEGGGVHDPATLKSEAIPVEAGDKIGVSHDYRFNADFGDLVTTTLAVELVADDGTYWYMLETGFWFQYPAGTGFLLPLNNEVGTSLDNTEWNSTSVEVSNEIPRSGNIYLHFVQVAPDAATVVYYQNLRFDYYPQINGSHRLYTGHEHKFAQTDAGYKPVVRKQVFIAEGIKKLFKGALHTFNGTAYILSPYFQNSRDGASAGFGVTSHGKLLANAYWNQYRDIMRKFDLTLRGLQTDSEDVPGLVDRFLINDTNISTTNRRFMAVSMSQNLRDSSWTAIVWEVYSLARGYEWDEAKYSFKYLT